MKVGHATTYLVYFYPEQYARSTSNLRAWMKMTMQRRS